MSLLPFVWHWVNYEITQVWESQLEQTVVYTIHRKLYNGMMGSCCFFVIHHITTKAIPGRKSPQRRESSDPISTTRITGLIARTWRSCFCRTLAQNLSTREPTMWEKRRLDDEFSFLKMSLSTSLILGERGRED